MRHMLIHAVALPMVIALPDIALAADTCTDLCKNGPCRVVIRPSEMPPSRTTLELSACDGSSSPKSVSWDPADDEVELERAMWLPQNKRWRFAVSSAAVRDANAVFIDARWVMAGASTDSTTNAVMIQIETIGAIVTERKIVPKTRTATIHVTTNTATPPIDWSGRLQTHRRPLGVQRARGLGIEGLAEKTITVIAQLVLNRFEAAGWSAIEKKLVDEYFQANQAQSLRKRIELIGLRSLMRDPTSIRTLVVEFALTRVLPNQPEITALLTDMLVSAPSEALAHEAIRQLQHMTSTAQNVPLNFGTILADCLRVTGCVSSELALTAPWDAWLDASLVVLRPSSALLDEAERYRALIRLVGAHPAIQNKAVTQFVESWTAGHTIDAMTALAAADLAAGCNCESIWTGLVVLLQIASAVEMSSADDAARALDSILSQLGSPGDRTKEWVAGIGATLGVTGGGFIPFGPEKGSGRSALSLPVGLTLQKGPCHFQLTVVDLGGFVPPVTFADGPNVSHPSVSRIFTPGIQFGFTPIQFGELRLLVAADVRFSPGENRAKEAFAQDWGIQVGALIGFHLPLFDFP